MQLTFTNVEGQLVAALERRAAEHGVSNEDEHRWILAKVLTGNSGGLSPKDFLLTIPDAGEDWIFDRYDPRNAKTQRLHVRGLMRF